MGKVFRATYYLVKSNKAFKKFPIQIELEELEGIKFMESYKNDKSVHEAIINIAQEIENKNLEKAACCIFVSFLCDGSTDLSTIEKELRHIILLDPDMHEVKMKFFSDLSVFEIFQSKGVSDVIGKKIYFASDSAMVNSGLKNGLITKMHNNFG